MATNNWLYVAAAGAVMWVCALLVASFFAGTGPAMDVPVIFGKILMFGGLVAALITFLFGLWHK